MTAAPHLRVITSDGEILEEHPELEALRTQIRMLERERAGQRLKIAGLEQDKARERLEHPRSEDIERCHRYWQRKCNHPRAGLDDAAFWCIAELLELRVKPRSEEREFAWPRDFKAAIDGAAHDPWTRVRKNGSVKRFDALKTVFKDADSMREFIARAPKAGA